jgi:hypothetical protein
MDASITFVDCRTYVRFDFRGRFALQPLLELMREIRASCIAHGHRRVLVDVRESQGALGTFDRYDHALEMAKPGNLGVRTAIVARPDQILPDRFWETVTRNRGHMTCVVTELNDALAWLATAEP